MKSSTSVADRAAFFRARRPLYYYITDRKRLDGSSLEACIRRAIACSVDCIQIREKDLSPPALCGIVRRAVSLACGTGCRILVNGNIDIALAAGAHGVHLPSTGLKVEEVRSRVPGHFIVGLSVHTLHGIMDAKGQGADYLLLGNIFSTECKPGGGCGLGLEFLRGACACASIPILALGGMRAQSVQAVIECGAAGIAGIGLFQDPEELSLLKEMIAGIRRC